jgi:hypothetical protein
MNDDDVIPDADDDPATRGVRALVDRARLLSAAVKVAAVLVLLASVAWAAGVEGARNLTLGLVFGTLTAIVNLALLAESIWALFEGRIVSGLVYGGASFVLLVLVAVGIGSIEPAWLLGYGLGITLPAFAGVVFALSPEPRAPR